MEIEITSTFRRDETAPFFGFLGASAALVFSCMRAAYGTAKSGVAVTSMGVMRPKLGMLSIALALYGLIVGIILSSRAGQSRAE